VLKITNNPKGKNMTPHEFIEKWKNHALTERAGAQEHFIDLCRILDHPTPAESDPTGEHFTFEKGVMKTGGSQGYADVWKKDHFAWEYKKRRRNLDEALVQLTKYAADLENPPLHIVCDTITFRIETRWTNTIVEKYEFPIEQLWESVNFNLLKAAFHDPESLKPTKTRADLTLDAANKFQIISDGLQSRNQNREAVAHFVNLLVFCFFANSVKLLPENMWKTLLDEARIKPERTKDWLNTLFAAMQNGGELNFINLKHFNGGLFNGSSALPLEFDEIVVLHSAHKLDWSLIDPTIFGTLFERFLDPDKRAQIGAHYTDPAKIMLVVKPVIARPLQAEWQRIKAQIATLMTPVMEAMPRKTKALEAAKVQAETLRENFLERLTKLRILDPACGSGNFLYLALQVVKDIEFQAIRDCEVLGLGIMPMRVGPEILHGIEINPFAAELARTSIWIGDIQWHLHNGTVQRAGSTILRNLNTIECRDALLTKQGDGYVAADWPEVDYIVGNPPFLGGQKLRNGSPAKYKTTNGENKLIREAQSGLGDEYVDTLFKTYSGIVPASSDLVCYWFAKAWDSIKNDHAKSAGFVSTNSIRGGANREVLTPIAEAEAIFETWSDEPWINDGAEVRVSIVCFSQQPSEIIKLNGAEVSHINADLSAQASNTTLAKRLSENANIAFQGPVKVGKFDIAGSLARAWLTEPTNVNGCANSDVLRPIINGDDIVGNPSGRWIIDFDGKTETAASYFQSPFEYVKREIKPA
jgi:N-6 DNA Methylase